MRQAAHVKREMRHCLILHYLNKPAFNVEQTRKIPFVRDRIIATNTALDKPSKN